jgi:RNA polymerase sigma-70 factor (ECF subfamily)
MTDAEFDQFFLTSYPRLVAMGLAMSTERHVAEELAQETMLRAYRHRDELAEYDAPIAWCRRVMGNLLIDHHRKRDAERSALQRAQSRVAAMPVPGTDSTDPAHLATSSRWQDLTASLTPQQRLVATLYYAEDQPIDVVAQTLQIATGTVKSALSKARNNLRRAIGDSLGGEALS